MAILREHLIEKTSISEACEKHGLQPTVFYQWLKKLFEAGARVFNPGRSTPAGSEGSPGSTFRRPSASRRQRS